jgi:hypothetical protein
MPTGTYGGVRGRGREAPAYSIKEVIMIRQEIVMCPKCGVLKELSEDCECSEEKESLEAKDGGS